MSHKGTLPQDSYNLNQFPLPEEVRQKTRIFPPSLLTAFSLVILFNLRPWCYFWQPLMSSDDAQSVCSVKCWRMMMSLSLYFMI